MAWAECKGCEAPVHWRARRGAKLADYRCPCGGELASAKAPKDKEKWARRQYARLASLLHIKQQMDAQAKVTA